METSVKVIGLSQPAKNDSSLLDMYINSGKFAGVCYAEDGWDTIKNQEEDKAIQRANSCAQNGHHSVFQHSMINLEIHCSKIMCMLLNSIGISNTSEKSARYTKMTGQSLKEQELYDKWTAIIRDLISEEYGLKFNEKEIIKLARENARYMLSVFTPTTMVYSIPFRNLCYIYDWFEKLYRSLFSIKNGRFNYRLYKEVGDMIEQIKPLIDPIFDYNSYISDTKNQWFRFLPVQSAGLVNDRLVHDHPTNYFGDVYSATFVASFAQVAQEQRHRTTRVKINFDGYDAEQYGFYIPKIVRKYEKGDQWIKDIRSVSSEYPQGTLVMVTEQGLFEDFALKCKERLCGRAQLEIQNVTCMLLKKFFSNYNNLSPRNQDILNDMIDYRCKYLDSEENIVPLPKPRCKFSDYTCQEGCKWIHDEVMNRLI